MNEIKVTYFIALALLVINVMAAAVVAQPPLSVYQATLLEADQKAPEVSTEELRKILAARSAIVLDARPYKEFALDHIPGAINVSARPGVPISLYVSDVAEIGRLIKGNKAAALLLYCNGPFCGKSKRLAAELIEAGYSNVRRYQLGIPVWRALGGVTAIENDAISYVLDNDKTAVIIDARDPAEFKAVGPTRARNIPRSLLKPGKDVGEIKAAKDDGRLPMLDHNTRIIVCGATGDQALAVAEAIVNEAFHNVSYFNGPIGELNLIRKP
jgi:rhodanese-related sulfurtransferase